VCIASILNGATIVTAPYFEPSQSIDLLNATEPTVLFPAYAQIMLGVLNHPNSTQLRLHRATRVLAVAPPETLRGLQARLHPAALLTTFGMTESCGCSTMTAITDSAEVRADTVGLPLRGLELRIADPDTDAPLTAGMRGEIQLRGPLLCDGYDDDPEANASTFLPDGWMKTGDQGTLDEHGRLSYGGRIKDMLKIGGENVSPAEVEAQLMTHPAVQVAQVVGIPDDRYGELPAAFVEVRPGASVTEAELREHCVGRIARFKIPHHWRFIEEWPMSATKIQKFKLRERLLTERGDPHDDPPLVPASPEHLASER
jgi:fatty-acyl-CoA synthase